MRAVFAALALSVPLAACGDATPTFGEGGWDDGDIEEAVPLGDEPAPPPVERPPEKSEQAEPEPEEAEEASEAQVAAPEPVAIAPAAPPAVEQPATPAPADDKPPAD